MGIEALPNSTVRAIGATQVLNDPTSVIKELIDNALDAQSTSISVEIHSNTLDSIQVRDNGHGIPPEDRLLVARPHCTSKIGGYEDLLAIGGTSLGFRGEALASAAEMSGSLMISTRVEGEEVASSLKINQQGEVISQSRASLPVGTTVRITDFIKAHPVRRQVALKNSEKTVGKIKQMLKAYAFARPHARLSLRVLKANNDKNNWTYAPKAGGNAEDAAFKIVGATCASQCTWSVIEDHGFMLQAFLPAQEGEVGKFSNIGPFVSVDGRPISTARGTPKQILKIFRDALKSSNPRAEGVKDPFIFLAIGCPSASYDANVEPAKDDVLFEDPYKLIALVRRLFEAVYPTPEKAAPTDRAEQQTKNTSSQTLLNRDDEDDFVTSLEPAAPGGFRERDAALLTSLPVDEPLPPIEDEDSDLRPRRTFRANMYGHDEEDLEFLDERPAIGHTETERQELRQARHDVSVSNPWILAKTNTTVRRQPLDDDENMTDGSGTPRRNDPALVAEQRSVLPTPGPSSPTKPSGTAFNSSNRQLIGSQSLPPPGPSIMPPSPGDLDCYNEPPAFHPQQTPAYNYNPPSQLDTEPSATPLYMIPNASPERRGGPKKPKQGPPANAPFKPPVQDQASREKVWFEHLEDIEQARPYRRPYQGRASNGLVVQGELGDLDDDPRPPTPPRKNRDVRDFFIPGGQAGHQSIADLIETRQSPQPKRDPPVRAQENLMEDFDTEPQEQLTRGSDASGFVRASELTTLEHFGPLKPDTSRTAKRRKAGEKRALREISGNAALQDEAADEEHETVVDNRAACKRRLTTDGSPSKSRRTKSSRLPLERVPKGQGTQNVVLVLSKSMREISSAAGKIDEERSLLAWNETSLGAYDVFATTSDMAAMEGIAAKLHTLLASHIPNGEMVQDLGVVVQGALAAHSQQALEVEMET